MWNLDSRLPGSCYEVGFRRTMHNGSRSQHIPRSPAHAQSCMRRAHISLDGQKMTTWRPTTIRQWQLPSPPHLPQLNVWAKLYLCLLFAGGPCCPPSFGRRWGASGLMCVLEAHSVDTEFMTCTPIEILVPSSV